MENWVKIYLSVQDLLSGEEKSVLEEGLSVRGIRFWKWGQEPIEKERFTIPMHDEKSVSNFWWFK